jgi:hypothetical protein
MSVFKKIKGIIGNIFLLGIEDTAHGIKDHTDGVAVVQNDESTLANAVVARPQGASQDTHASTYLDTKERVIDIEWSFAGATAPAPGTNTGKYGLCHTSGGGYSAGNIYLDDGAVLTLIPMYHMMACSPRSAITGTVSMIADGLYLAEGSAAPWTWTLKGDGSMTYTGVVQAIEVPFGFADFPGIKSSTASIPTNAKVIRSIVKVATLFTPGAAPTVAVDIDGPATDTALRATTDQNLKKVDQYDVTDEITNADGGPVRLTLAAGGAVLAGAATCLVEYVTPFA